MRSADIDTGAKADAFIKQLLNKCPETDAVIINAGIQHTQDWSDPDNVNLEGAGHPDDLYGPND